MANDKIVIHIGLHKSGSTLLQKIMKASNVNYCFVSGTEDREELDNVQSEDFDDVRFKSWVKNFEKDPEYPWFISHEELSGHPHGYHEVDVAVVMKNLYQVFPTAQILLILRNPVSYVLSLYAYRCGVKGFETRHIEKFITEEFEKGLKQKLDYRRLLKVVYARFPKDNVSVMKYELLENNPAEFWNEIEVVTGITIDKKLLNNRRVNSSTKSIVAIKFARVYNQIVRLFLPVSRKDNRDVRVKLYELRRPIYYRLGKLFSRELRSDKLLEMHNELKSMDDRYREEFLTHWRRRGKG